MKWSGKKGMRRPKTIHQVLANPIFLPHFSRGAVMQNAWWFFVVVLVGTTLVHGADKKPKPGSGYEWTLSNGTGSVAVSISWESYDHVLRGKLTNSTTLRIAEA